MSNICVYHAVLDFHVRDFSPFCRWIARSAPRTRRDFVIAQFSNFAYEYNVWLTTSQRIASPDGTLERNPEYGGRRRDQATI